jgi:ribosome-binding protein aMBF1 (putative translation factor)
MPKDWDPHYEDEQDWEPVVFKKDNTQSSVNSQQESPIHSKICLARSRAGYTAHELAQKLHMRIKDYQRIENGEQLPTIDLLGKLRKIINLQ